MVIKPDKCDNPLFQGPERYFDEHGRFKPDLLAKDIVDYMTVITLTSTNEIFGWHDGYYVGGSEGENILLAWLRDILRERLGKVTRHQTTELMNQVRLRSYSTYEVFDSDLDLLPLRNGVLNTRTREFEPYSKAKHYFLFQLPVEYDPNADCPGFREFVQEVVYPEDVPLVQEVFGYCLWRDGLASIKKAIMLLGDGDNGKSLWVSILIAMLGSESVESISLSNLSENRFASAYLRGKLANIHPDVPDRALRETGQFKALTGDDLINYEIKHGGQGKFWNRAKLIFAANKLPDAQDDASAYYTRWVIVNFPYSFVRGKKELSGMERPAKDKNELKAKMTTPEELSGILNWALEGLRRLQQNGCFTNEVSADEMRNIYVRLANTLKAFLLDMCEMTADPSHIISKEDFYQRYAKYCIDKNLIPFKKEKVGRELPSCHPGKIEAGKDTVRGYRVPTWRGIRLKSDVAEASADRQCLLDASEVTSQ